LPLNLFTPQPEKGYDLLDDKDTGEFSLMLLRGSWQSHFAKVITDKKIKTLRLSFSAGWRDEKLDFLKDVFGLEGLEIYSYEVRDVSLAMSFPDLKRLSISAPFNGRLDMSCFPVLEHFSAVWRRGICDLDACQALTKLRLSAYPHSDLMPLASFSQLRRLDLYSRKLATLKGVSHLSALMDLSLSYCAELVDIMDLVKHKALTRLEFDHCKRLVHLPLQFDLPVLSEMTLNNCPAISSLHPLRSLNTLTKLNFIENTSIKDGHIAFLSELPALKEVWCQNRRHYDITHEALYQMLNPKLA